jgi:hypothetical protein
LARALYLVARCGDNLSAQPKRPYWFMRPAHPRDLLAIASALLLLTSAASAAGSLRDWVRNRSTPAVAAVQPNSTKDSAFPTRTQIRTAPQVPAVVENVPPKSAPKASAQKRISANSVPQARENSPAHPLTDPSPLP